MNGSRILVFCVGVLVAMTWSCGDDDLSGDCSSEAECSGTQICVDRRCVAAPDGGPLDTGADPRDVGAVDAADEGMMCATMIFCGDPPLCCNTGTECIEGLCIAQCDSGVRCGGVCCGSESNVCIDATCVEPGRECGDNFDCPEDFFCEPTLDRCLPQFDPVTCETEPIVGDFEVTTELELTSSDVRNDCFHAISAPIVIDLDGDEIPELIANMACDDAWVEGALRVFHGNTGEEVWVSTLLTHGRTGIAAGDLDGTGNVAIIVLSSPHAPDPRRVVAFNADGTERWRSTDGTGAPLQLVGDNGAPTLVDLDGDGRTEILYGATALDANGQLLWSSGQGGNEGTNDGYTGGITVAVDIDDDGLVDVVTGARAWERDGTPKWVAHTMTGGAVPDGYAAVAQFDDDAAAEVVLVASGSVYLIDGATGIVQWGPFEIPGGGRGGPPTVADFDGDGRPEVGAAGGASYTVYDPTGERDVLWSRDTLDESSNATGSSVFDFEGDGIAEVVYQDECHVWVYRGDDGSVLLSIPSTSATIHEYPIVVDVDGDGNSELVTVANDRAVLAQCGDGFEGHRKGIFVYGDASDRWVRTRRIWNQHAYNVTNVGSAGGVPTAPRLNWTVDGLNNFRQNSPGEAAFNAPDLQVGLEVRLDGCPRRVTLRARVTNAGNLGVAAGVPVAFYDADDTELARVSTTIALLPGASEVLEVMVDLAEVVGGASYRVVVDPAAGGESAVLECREDNNEGRIGGVECDLLI